MGAGQSGGVEIGGSTLGYQVLRVYPNSPGSKSGLKAYFDFIVAIGNTRFNKEDGSLREILKASVDQKLKMIVFNTRNKMAREVEIVPTTSWGGSGLLGVSIKHSSFDKADERVWHVVEVDPGSPAQQAGFKAGEDYVIGSDSILQENDDLYNLIEAHEGKALKLFVYNVTTDNCREVICHPNSKWGGRGYLGCEFGHGLLHRIPYTEEQVVGGDSKSAISTPPLVQQQQLKQQTNGGSVPTRNPPMVQPQQQPQSSFAQTTPNTQPGHQLFQQALFSQNQSRPPMSAQQQSQQTDQRPVLPQPPQAPQTFAQLASAQFQAQQSQQHQQPSPSNPSESLKASVPQTSEPLNISQVVQQQQQQQQPSNKQDQSSDSKLPSQNYGAPPQAQSSYQASQQYPMGQGNFADLLNQSSQQVSGGQQQQSLPIQQNQMDHLQQSAQGQQYFCFQPPNQQQQQQPNQSYFSDPLSSATSAPPSISTFQTLPPPPPMYPQQGPPPPPPPSQQAQQQTYNFGLSPQQPQPPQPPSESPYNQMFK